MPRTPSPSDLASEPPNDHVLPLSAGAAVPGPDRLVGEAAADLRGHTARGTVVNGAFLVGLNALGVIGGLIVAGALGAAVYGLWGLLTVTFATLFWLAAVGVDDKYIQQDHPDQVAAFQIAFTLQAVLCACFVAAATIAVPAFAFLYGYPEVIAPGLALVLGVPAIALQTPVWVFYRRMQYARQRTLQAIDPVVCFVVTVALLAVGWELWALIVGTLAGAWTAGLVIARASPYPLRLRYEKGALAEYASFSWPLFVGSASGVLVTQIPTIVAARTLGAAAIGAMALAAHMSHFTARVDEIVTQTLYPAICTVKDRTALLFEIFAKSNRLALLWAAPCGAGIALFAADVVPAVLGESWRAAVPVVQILAVAAAVDQIAFNWSAYYRARGETRPIAISNLALLAGGLLVAVPLMLAWGITGYAAGMAVATVAVVTTRILYLRRLFPGMPMLRQLSRGFAPTVPAVAAALIVRALGAGTALEMTAFVLAAVTATAALEHRLLRESVGYLGRRTAG